MIQKLEEDVAGHGVARQLFALCTKALTNSPQPAVHAACQIQKLCRKLSKGQAGQAPRHVCHTVFRPTLCRQVTSTLILGTSAGNSLLL